MFVGLRGRFPTMTEHLNVRRSGLPANVRGAADPNFACAVRAFAAMFPGRFDLADWQPPVAPAADYWAMLEPLGEVTAWETDYIQPLPADDDAHPVRRFTESTAMRPFLDRMDQAEARSFIRAYDEALASAYPLRPDGSALMPFRRTFFTLRR